MKHLIIILFCGLVWGGCKKPVEENIIGTWRSYELSEIKDYSIVFKGDGTIIKEMPEEFIEGFWYLEKDKVFFEANFWFLCYNEQTENWDSDTCFVKYQVTDCKKNKIWVKDIETSGKCICSSASIDDGGLGSTWEYKRVK